MAMPNYNPAPPKKSNALWWILGGIAFLGLLCCGGIVGLGMFGINKVNEHMTYGNGVMERLSSANYQVGPNSNDFAPSLTSGADAEQFAGFLQLVSEKMGAYQKQGAMTSYNFNSNNGAMQHELIFQATFEKGDGTVEMVYTGDGDTRRVIGIAVKSPNLMN